MRKLYLDLDGVLADFDSNYLLNFGKKPDRENDDTIWENINSHQSFFADMPPFDYTQDFWERVEHLAPVILTACPRSDYKRVAIQKRAWCRKHLSPNVEVLPVMGGRNKWLFMNKPRDVLIDDFTKNINPWIKAGGTGIHHTSYGITIATLKLLELIDV
jgi:FMN phosphatase YigB (HAD superfamily)